MPEEKKIRVNLYVLPSLVSDLDYIARQETAKQNTEVNRTDLVNENLTDFVKRWEKKNGPIPTK